jgi:predicted metalloprotease with PDZ domain
MFACAALLVVTLYFPSLSQTVKLAANRNSAAQPVAPPEISYTVGMPRPFTNLLEVEMRVRGERLPEQVDLIMPVWAPGSYLIREFERNVLDFTARDANGTALDWHKTNKNTWRIEAAKNRELVVTYHVYAKELGVRTSEVTDSHAFWNNTNVLMYPDGHLRTPSTIRVVPFGDWQIYTTLAPAAGQPNTYRADNFDLLYDSPFIVGRCQVLEFDVARVPHRLVIDGEGNYDAERLRAGLQKLVETESAMMGGLPYRNYTFFVIMRTAEGGGLEHLNSNVIIAARHSFGSPAGYHSFFHTAAHELFHAWNVKRIRPENLGPFDYSAENYTRLLWVAEGITDYYADKFMVRAGFWSEKEYLSTWAAQIKELDETPGRLQTSLEETSFDAWIKYYRPDAFSINRQVSYYDKGSIVGAMLDLEIRRATKGARSLDDVLRYLYREMALKDHNCTAEDFQAVVETLAGKKLDDFFQRYVRGRDEIDYNAFLAAAGLQLDPAGAVGVENAPKPAAYLGLQAVQDGDRLIVRRIPAGSPAFDQGLNTGDQILAVNGVRVNQTGFYERLAERKPGDTVSLTIFRDDDLRTIQVKLGGRVNAPYRILPVDTATQEQKDLYRAWIGK